MSIPNSEYRFLGPTGLRVSSISLGGWVTVGTNAQLEDSKALQIFDKAYKSGINYFDTAEEYDDGECEVSLGKIIQQLGWRRDTFVLSTKLFWGFCCEHVNALGLSRKHIMEGAKASLKRLQVDYVDIIFAHRPDKYTPMEEVVRAFTQLINDGKAFYWGTSMWSAYEIEHACHIATKYNLIKPVVEQPLYNMLERNQVEDELEPIFKEYGYGSTVFSPLATGLLTGKYNNGVPQDSRYAAKEGDEMLERIYENKFNKANITRVKELSKICDKLNVEMAPLALAWLLKNKNISTVITGASKPEQIEKNLEAYTVLDKLTPEIMEQIEKILNNAPLQDSSGAGRLGSF